MSVLSSFRQSLNDPTDGPNPVAPSAVSNVNRVGSPEPGGSDTEDMPDSILSAPTRRRQREDSAACPVTPRTIKRLKSHARSVCKDHNLPEDSLEKFVELDIRHMLIDLKGHILHLEDKSRSDEYTELMASNDFKQSLHDRLLACLLSPNLTAYVTDIVEHVMDVIKRNLAIFKIPKAVFEDQFLLGELEAAVRTSLTNGRSSMKQKLGASMGKNQCISQLTKSMAPKGIEITTAHWSRVAFLRRTLTDFNALKSNSSNQRSSSRRSMSTPSLESTEDDNQDAANEDESEKGTQGFKENQYWNYVDHQLVSLRELATEKGNTSSEQEELYTKFFTTILQEDMQNYKPGPRAPKAAAAPSDWQSVVHAQLMWS